MEHQSNSDLSPAPTTILALSNDLLDHIFQLLEIHDWMSLAGACCRLKDVSVLSAQKKYGTFVLDYQTTERGNDYIDRIFCEIGQHFKSLTIQSRDKGEYVLRKATENCMNLKSLHLYWLNVNGNRSRNIPSLSVFNHLELLTLQGCYISDVRNFFGTISSLHVLSIKNGEVYRNDLIKCFHNNSDMKAFTYDGLDSSYFQQSLIKWLKLLRNLESLNLSCDFRILNIVSLSQLNRLTRIRLYFAYYVQTSDSHRMLSDFLNKLSKYGNLTELELVNLEIYNATDDALQSCESLKLLIIKSIDKWQSSWRLSPNLTDLRLTHLKISIGDISSIIQRHQSLANLVLDNCSIATDSTSITLVLPTLVDCNDQRPILNVVFIDLRYESKQIFTVGRLRMSFSRKYPKNFNVVRINFPSYIDK